LQHDYHTQASYLNDKLKKSWEKAPSVDVPERQTALLTLVPSESVEVVQLCPTSQQRRLVCRQGRGSCCSTPSLHSLALTWAPAILVREAVGLNLTRSVLTWSYSFPMKQHSSKSAQIQKPLWSHTLTKLHLSCVPPPVALSAQQGKMAYMGSKRKKLPQEARHSNSRQN